MLTVRDAQHEFRMLTGMVVYHIHLHSRQSTQGRISASPTGSRPAGALWLWQWQWPRADAAAEQNNLEN